MHPDPRPSSEPDPSLAGLTRAQARNYTRFARSVNTRGLPAPVRAFLLTLREQQLRADLTGPELARRAVEIQRAQGETACHGLGLVGHTRDGRFSAAVLSGELIGRTRLPRPELVQVVARAYAHRMHLTPGPVLARLEAQRADALSAAVDHEHRRRR